jgi:hypothetical protein
VLAGLAGNNSGSSSDDDDESPDDEFASSSFDESSTLPASIVWSSLVSPGPFSSCNRSCVVASVLTRFVAGPSTGSAAPSATALQFLLLCRRVTGPLLLAVGAGIIGDVLGLDSRCILGRRKELEAGEDGKLNGRPTAGPSFVLRDRPHSVKLRSTDAHGDMAYPALGLDKRGKSTIAIFMGKT